MKNIPQVVIKRLITSALKFKKILLSAKERDVNESDTVTIVTDMLEEVFGFDKYSDITREYAIQGTYCDLVIKTDNKIKYLIEVKAIGLDLSNKHLKQAINYASREGVKWVVLTNGVVWEVHRVTLDQKIEHKKLFNFDFTQVNLRQTDQQELLFLLCKRGVEKDLMDDFYEYKQSCNHYIVGSMLLTDAVVNLVRRELRKFKPGLKVDSESIKEIIEHEVIKREIIESDAGIDAKKQITKFLRKQEKQKNKSQAND